MPTPSSLPLLLLLLLTDVAVVRLSLMVMMMMSFLYESFRFCRFFAQHNCSFKSRVLLSYVWFMTRLLLLLLALLLLLLLLLFVVQLLFVFCAGAEVGYLLLLCLLVCRRETLKTA